MQITFQKMLDYFAKDKSHYPIALLYNKYNSGVFKKISCLVNSLKSNNNNVLRLSKLFLNSNSNSYFVDMFQKAIKNTVDFVRDDKIIIIDSFLPLIPNFDINCVVNINYISKFDDIDSRINKFNTKLILGMTYEQYERIPVQNSMLRRYKGLEFDICELDEQKIKKDRIEILKFDDKFLPTPNRSSIWSFNPLYLLINKQIGENRILNTINDAIINLILNFKSIDLNDIRNIFRQLFTEEITEVDIVNIYNNSTREISKIQVLNIIQIIKYLHLLPDVFDLRINDKDLEFIINL